MLVKVFIAVYSVIPLLAEVAEAAHTRLVYEKPLHDLFLIRAGAALIVNQAPLALSCPNFNCGFPAGGKNSARCTLRKRQAECRGCVTRKLTLVLRVRERDH